MNKLHINDYFVGTVIDFNFHQNYSENPPPLLWGDHLHPAHVDLPIPSLGFRPRLLTRAYRIYHKHQPRLTCKPKKELPP